MAKPQYCPKSDEGVRSAVKQGALVVGFGKSAQPVCNALRAALGYRAREGDGWEETRVNHLVIVVECMPTNGDCCEAANKFMRDIRKSDGYPVYSEIIGRKVAVLGLGKMGKVSGAGKVEQVLLKRGGCACLIAPPTIGTYAGDGSDVATLPWTRKVCDALAATMDPPPPLPPPPPPPPTDFVSPPPPPAVVGNAAPEVKAPGGVNALPAAAAPTTGAGPKIVMSVAAAAVLVGVVALGLRLARARR